MAFKRIVLTCEDRATPAACLVVVKRRPGDFRSGISCINRATQRTGHITGKAGAGADRHFRYVLRIRIQINRTTA